MGNKSTVEGCVHHWILGELLVGRFDRYVDGRRGRCERCGLEKVLRERTYAVSSDGEEYGAQPSIPPGYTALAEEQGRDG